MSSRISPDIQLLRVSKSAKEDNLNLQFDRDEKINDTFEGIVLKWVFVCTQFPGLKEIWVCNSFAILNRWFLLLSPPNNSVDTLS